MVWKNIYHRKSGFIKGENMDKETYNKLAEISAISCIPIEELEMAYNSLANQYDPKLAKTLKCLEKKCEEVKTFDNLKLAINDFKMTIMDDFHIDKLLDWLEGKLTKIERWWKNKNC